MGLTMSEKRSVAAQMAAGYQRARKKGKGVILAQFVELDMFADMLRDCCGSTVRRPE